MSIDIRYGAEQRALVSCFDINLSNETPLDPADFDPDLLFVNTHDFDRDINSTMSNLPQFTSGQLVHYFTNSLDFINGELVPVTRYFQATININIFMLEVKRTGNRSLEYKYNGEHGLITFDTLVVRYFDV
jgi:hypothetical protein